MCVCVQLNMETQGIFSFSQLAFAIKRTASAEEGNESEQGELEGEEEEVVE